MLIKQADDQTERLSELEQKAQKGGPGAKHANDELRKRRAGIRGEQDAAYLIDFDYAGSPNWAVIHDLHLEHGDRTAQIDHLLINRWMDIYVLETKSFHSGIKITEEGEFLRSNQYTHSYEGMASPLEQNERHIQVLKDVIASIDWPTRLGLRIAPNFQSFVLVSASARIIRPNHFDSSRVIKVDQLKKSIWRDIDNENGVLTILKTAAKIVSSETVESVARRLAELHKPLHRQPRTGTRPIENQSHRGIAAGPRRAKRIEPILSPANQKDTVAPQKQTRAPSVASAQSPAALSDESAPSCKKCNVKDGNILYGKYGYYFQCNTCSTNTSMRFSCLPGHKPKLRKDRDAFYRECVECATSTLYHQNKGGGSQ